MLIIQNLQFISNNCWWLMATHFDCHLFVNFELGPYLNQNLPWKLGQQSATCWNSFGLFRDYKLNYIFLGIKLFFVFQDRNFSICLKLNSAKPQKISTHSALWDNFYFHFFYQLSDWLEILWGFTKFYFKPILKVSAFLSWKTKKSFIPKKNIF